MSIFKSVRFWIPFAILASMIAGSFIVPVLYPDLQAEGPPYITDPETAKVIAAAPYSPSEMPPMGSDRLGRNIFLLLIDGAKYTLLGALAIALLRMAGGFATGLLYAFMPSWLRSGFKGFWDTFNFIPLAIVGYILLYPLQAAYEVQALTSMRFLIIEVVVIALIVIPSLGMYVGQGMNDFMKQEFVDVSRQMGASRFHLIKKHLLPHYGRHSIVLFSEQLSQTLLLLIQLGILKICLGGLMTAEFGIMESIPVYFSAINEWAATISINIQQVFIKPYIVLGPLLFFAISIYCVNEISSVLRSVLIEGNSVGLKRLRKKNRQTSMPAATHQPQKGDFSFADKEKKAC
ncbi:ABC transporter permease subunit [Rossellomorea vietnamensis]|uniref:ABC transporter permease subunit n=1 Tax=Rossellomorea vietnamensis TaxID=218284 RepID=A0A5D4KF01_9BACI|nr:ABC transporter permease subunit [Rossellomorea vietnamensis]TYR74813.1 ABC transporter permease subunit [Rossellomorea vietnamensis]